jgi:chromosome segregation ATPase
MCRTPDLLVDQTVGSKESTPLTAALTAGFSGVMPRSFRREKMNSVTDARYAPNPTDAKGEISKPNLDWGKGEFEQQMKILGDEQGVLNDKIQILTEEERSPDQAEPDHQERAIDQNDGHPADEKEKILNEEMGVLNREMHVLSQELGLVDQHGRSSDEKMRILNEEMSVLNKEMDVLKDELRLVNHAEPRSQDDKCRSRKEKMKILSEEMNVLSKEMNVLNQELKLVGRHGRSSAEKMKILNEQMQILNQELNVLNEELEALN